MVASERGVGCLGVIGDGSDGEGTHFDLIMMLYRSASTIKGKKRVHQEGRRTIQNAQEFVISSGGSVTV